MEEELQEKVCAMLRHATSTSGADIGLEDALGLAWVGLALSHEASILGGGSSDLRASVAGALVDAVMEVSLLCPAISAPDVHNGAKKKMYIDAAMGQPVSVGYLKLIGRLMCCRGMYAQRA